MPYIKQEDKDRIFCNLDMYPSDFGIVARSVGELNYIITEIIVEYLTDKGLCYDTCNEIVGVLESAKAEFQRRIVANYEDQKCKENGDVYDGIFK
jgi:hypothetical protein